MVLRAVTRRVKSRFEGRSPLGRGSSWASPVTNQFAAISCPKTAQLAPFRSAALSRCSFRGPEGGPGPPVGDSHRLDQAGPLDWRRRQDEREHREVAVGDDKEYAYAPANGSRRWCQRPSDQVHGEGIGGWGAVWRAIAPCTAWNAKAPQKCANYVEKKPAVCELLQSYGLAAALREGAGCLRPDGRLVDVTREGSSPTRQLDVGPRTPLRRSGACTECKRPSEMV